MRAEALERLRQTMRGGEWKKPVGTAGTLEPAPFQVSVPTSSNARFQPETPGVPTVPTVPTQFCKVQKVEHEKPQNRLEPALEPVRNRPAQVPSFDADMRNREAVAMGLTDRFCQCGTMATVAVGRFRPDKGNPEGVSRWVCNECFSNGRG